MIIFQVSTLNYGLDLFGLHGDSTFYTQFKCAIIFHITLSGSVSLIQIDFIISTTP